MNYIYNISNTLESRIILFNILSECLEYLDYNKNKNSQYNIESKKEKIILFYYILIFLMPFDLGTASISEMALYSLWKYYIGTEVRINPNIMIDVEALTNDFDTFKYNCLNIARNISTNRRNQQKYTPYLSDIDLYSNNTNNDNDNNTISCNFFGLCSKNTK